MKAMVKRFVCMVLVLCVLASVAVTASAAGVSDFSDVSRSRWSYKAVSHARSMGYVNGVGGNRFDPRGEVTMGQLAQVLYNLAGRPRYALFTCGSDTKSMRNYRSAAVAADPEKWLAGIHDEATYYTNKLAEIDKEHRSDDYRTAIPDCLESADLAFYVDLEDEDYLDKYLEGRQKYEYPWFSESVRRKLGGKWYAKAMIWCSTMLDGGDRWNLASSLDPNDKADRLDVVASLHETVLYLDEGRYDNPTEWVDESSNNFWSFHKGEPQDFSGWSDKSIESMMWQQFPEYYAFGEAKVEDGVVKVAKYDAKELYDEEGKAWLEEEYDVRYAPVLWAVRNNIIKGNGTYSADGKKNLNLEDNVTREEFAQFLYNYDRYAV